MIQILRAKPSLSKELFLFLFGVGATLGRGAEPVEQHDKSQYNLFNPTPREFMRELSPDRPDKTDTPYTVDAGHFQLEMDFVNMTYNRANSERGDERLTSVEAAPMTVKVGVLNNLDAQLHFTPYRWDKTENTTTGATERKSGFDGITPRLKLNLMGNDGGFFALALLPFVTIPLSQDGLETSSVQGGLAVPFSFDIPGWDVGAQTTVQINRNETGSDYHAEFDNSITIGHSLIGKLGVAVEFFSSVSTESGAGWVGTFDTWLTYQLNEDTRFDGGVYIGLNDSSDDWHPWIGMTRRF